MDIASIILGWLLGILSPVIVSRIHRKYAKTDLRKGLVSELDETRYRLVCTSYLLGQSYGKFDKEYLRLYEGSPNRVRVPGNVLEGFY